MKISTKSSIAMHCLIFIAEYGERTRVTSGLLAKSTGCNPAAIRSILGALQRAGLIAIARGVGGAHLAVDPAQLTLWDVYRALGSRSASSGYQCVDDQQIIRLIPRQ
mgnify:CR=1 FL=1